MRVQGEKYQELALIVTSHDFHFTMAIFFILEVVTNIEQNHPIHVWFWVWVWNIYVWFWVWVWIWCGYYPIIKQLSTSTLFML